MKVNDIVETLITGNPEKIMSSIIDSVDLDSLKHIGDIEHYKVLFNNYLYLIMDQDSKVGYAVIEMDGNTPVLDQLYITDAYRGKGIGEMFILFLKRVEGYNKIKFGLQQSLDAIKMVDRISHRFDIYWEKDGETMDYNDSNNDIAYSYGGNTGWQLILENHMGMESERFFNSESPKMSMFYECLLRNDDDES